MYSQKNIELLFTEIGKLPGQEFVRSEFYDFVKVPNSIWPNQLINLRTNREAAEQLLQNIERKSKEGRIPNLLMCSPVTDDPNLIKAIQAKGYKQSVWTAMTHDLSPIKEMDKVENLRIKQLDSLEEFNLWLEIVERELMLSEKLDNRVFQKLFRLNSCHFFLGYTGTKAVATSMLFRAENSGGVYLVATDKNSRGRRFGSQMTHICLAEAKRLGCKQVDLQATSLGMGVYESLGFKNHGPIHVFRIVANSNE
jgi:ribosomal protein S18 acetylase RimI-like enzyme